MLTLETNSPEFITNANQTGIMKFSFVKRETNLQDKNVYIYVRTIVSTGKVFGYEVFIPSVKKAGTYPLPAGKTITYTEDFEEYPGASIFGKRAFFCVSIEQAEIRFKTLLGNSDEEIKTEENKDDEIISTQHKKGRPKTDRPSLLIPLGEFSVKELAEHNKVEYPTAFVYIKEQEILGSIKRTREERRAAKGKLTQLFQKIT